MEKPNYIFQNYPYVYQHWDNLPTVKLLSLKDFKKLDQDIRQIINKVLVKGLSEKHPKTEETIKRHVMSANEILEQIGPNIDQEVTKSNLYFHLNTLEKAGIIEVVANIGSGREISAYYGKTAKHYLLSDTTEKPQLELISKTKFLDFVNFINPNISRRKIKETLKIISDIQLNKRDAFLKWLDVYDDLLRKYEINFAEFFNLINFLKIDDPRIFKSIIKFSELLHIDLEE